SLQIDPVDDCTFWYANEYIPANGTFNWKTRIASFKLPGCGAAVNDFSISATPTSFTVAQGNSGTSAISTAVTSGAAQSVALSVTALPSGVSGSFSPATMTAGASSTLTISASSTAPAGTTPFTVTGTSGATAHSASASITVTTGPSTLTDGVPVGNLSGATGSQQFWVMNVPAGKDTLTVTISGGSGDADLYVRLGAQPTTTTFTCRPFLTGNNETCTVSNPSAGDWYVMIRGFAAFSGVTLKGTYTP